MPIKGVIRPTVSTASFNRDAWCQLVNLRPEFRRPPTREITNPFTGKASTIRARNDVAQISLDGRVIGSASWSMTDEALVDVSVEESALPMVMKWAAELGGEFHENNDVR